jgi:hypothetical protein
MKLFYLLLQIYPIIDKNEACTIISPCVDVSKYFKHARSFGEFDSVIFEPNIDSSFVQR